MKKLLKFVFTELVYAGHLQSIGSAGIVFLSSLATDNNFYRFDMLLEIYLVFQTIYFFDRYKDVNKDEPTNITRSLHMKKYLRKIPYILLIFFLLIIFICLYLSNLLTLYISIFIVFMGILYPLFFKGLTKYIWAFKNIYVALVHGLLVFFPMFYLGLEIKPYFILVYLFFLVFFEALVMQILLDVKDITGDKKLGFLTIPVLYGKNPSLYAVKILSIVSGIFFSFLNLALFSNLIIYVLILLNLVLNFYTLDKIKNSKPIGYIISAGKFSLWFVLLIIHKILI